MPSGQSLIGVAVAVAGNVTISLALNCQKLAHLRLQREEPGGSIQDQAPERTTRPGDARLRRRTSPKEHDSGGAQGDEQEYDAEEEDEEETEGGDVEEGRSYASLPRARKKRGREEASSSTASSSAESSVKRTHVDRDEDRGSHDLESARKPKQNQSDTNEQSGTGNGSSTSTEFLRSKLWWLGIALMTIGEGGNFISYGFAPASLVAPLGAVALLSNVIISPILLKERFKAADIGGIFLAIIGAVTVVFSSKQNDDRLGPTALLEAIKRLEFVIYASISVGLGIFLTFLSRTKFADRWVLVDVGACAIFGGFTVLSTKGISSLISGGRPLEALRFPITYVLVLVLAVTAVIQITYLNKALQRFDSREVIPTQFVFFTISAIVGSAILYRDFEDTDLQRLVNFLFGCLTTFAGVFVLTRKKDDEDRGQSVSDGTEDQDEEAEEGVSERDGLLSRSWHGGDQRGLRATSNRGRAATTAAGSTQTSSNRKLVGLVPPLTSSPVPRRPGPAPTPASAAMTTGSVPFSALVKSHRQRSRTASPGKFDSAGKGDPPALSRSATASTGQLSTSFGLRTPRLGLIGLDRPTGLSPGHYLLFAHPPSALTLASSQKHPRPSSSYGSVGESAPLLLPMYQGDLRGGTAAAAVTASPEAVESSARAAGRHRRGKSRASQLDGGAGGTSGDDGRGREAQDGNGGGKRRRTSQDLGP